MRGLTQDSGFFSWLMRLTAQLFYPPLEEELHWDIELGPSLEEHPAPETQNFFMAANLEGLPKDIWLHMINRGLLDPIDIFVLRLSCKRLHETLSKTSKTSAFMLDFEAKEISRWRLVVKWEHTLEVLLMCIAGWFTGAFYFGSSHVIYQHTQAALSPLVQNGWTYFVSPSNISTIDALWQMNGPEICQRYSISGFMQQTETLHDLTWHHTPMTAILLTSCLQGAISTGAYFLTRQFFNYSFDRNLRKKLKFGVLAFMGHLICVASAYYLAETLAPATALTDLCALFAKRATLLNMPMLANQTFGGPWPIAQAAALIERAKHFAGPENNFLTSPVITTLVLNGGIIGAGFWRANARGQKERSMREAASSHEIASNPNSKKTR